MGCCRSIFGYISFPGLYMILFSCASFGLSDSYEINTFWYLKLIANDKLLHGTFRNVMSKFKSNAYVWNQEYHYHWFYKAFAYLPGLLHDHQSFSNSNNSLILHISYESLWTSASFLPWTSHHFHFYFYSPFRSLASFGCLSSDFESWGPFFMRLEGLHFCWIFC